ncbi:class I SAM-dependent methyltransferase [Rhizobacter sp. Root1221]|uniref:class I SAM-dependent methyltransferase n=1 Tax=Rhizobacter sp. Root1221 TaxID=1736433 RepID=UPI000AD6F875|nr:class I SAM-dependent methyltransferase [Rhizobacter sp. Root1221]
MDSVERTLDSWELTTEPIRPGAPDLAYMTAQIKKRFAKPRVLILGMTPELVDMALQLGAARVVVMELRAVGLAAYKELVEGAFESINGDWRVYQRSCDQAFDVILGHGSFIFLSFPSDWLATLAVVRKYLVPGGILSMRHFHVPPVEYPFPPNYKRLLEEFEARASGADETRRAQEFITTVTSLRCSAILGATQPDGVVDQVELDRLMAWAKQDLEQKYGHEKVWQRMRDEFDYPTAAGYGSVRPLAAPRLDQVIPVLEAGGLAIEDVTPIGDQPLPGCFVFVTGTFKAQ